MTGLMTNYKKYEEQLKTMEQPVCSQDIPDIYIDLPAMVAYARKNSKKVAELTDAEKAMFTRPTPVAAAQ